MTEPDRWRDWTLVALATRRPAGSSRAERELSLIEQVAILFADRFEPADRAYDPGSRPRWHAQVRAVLADLREHALLGARDVLSAGGAGRGRPGPGRGRRRRSRRRRTTATGRGTARSRCSPRA